MTEEIKNEQENSVQQATQEEALQLKVVELEEKLAKANDQVLRGLAEIENIRRRAREEQEKTSKYAISNFVSELVLPVETFFLVCDNAPKDQIEQVPEIKHFVDAVDMTKKELMKILEKNQVKRIFPLNEKFDHNFHEAIAHIESDKEENTVVQVIQAGYAIGDRLIRPALVGVSKGKI
jgi:molecular chaperone GrpE